MAKQVEIGKWYGHAKAIALAEREPGDQQNRYLFRCECGNTFTKVRAVVFRRGENLSCGCFAFGGKVESRYDGIDDEDLFSLNEKYQETDRNEKYDVGDLCLRGHDWRETGMSLRDGKHGCLFCNWIKLKWHHKFNKKLYKKEKCFCSVCGDMCTHKNKFSTPGQCARYQWKLYTNNNKKWIEIKKEERKRHYLEYYEKNKGKIVENYRMKYREDEEFREKERKRVIRYKHINPEKAMEWGNKRQKIMAENSTGTVTRVEICKLFARFKTCPYCGKKIRSGDAHIDHLVPLSKGGLHTISNLVVCCSSCNLKKSAKDLNEWEQEIKKPYQKRLRKILRDNAQFQLSLPIQ